jgi:hypothetical protein
MVFEFVFAPLREMYLSLGEFSQKGAKAYLSRKENQSKTPLKLMGSSLRHHRRVMYHRSTNFHTRIRQNEDSHRQRSRRF